LFVVENESTRKYLNLSNKVSQAREINNRTILMAYRKRRERDSVINNS